MPDLKPCPFCGALPELSEIGNNYTKKRSVVIKCPGCRATMKNSALRYGMDWLIDISVKGWNSRAELEEVAPSTSNNKAITKLPEFLVVYKEIVSEMGGGNNKLLKSICEKVYRIIARQLSQ